MNNIKFTGRDKREAIKKAVDFYYTNLNNGLEIFLAKCRLQLDKTTIIFYPHLKADIKKYREFKANRRKGKQ